MNEFPFLQLLFTNQITKKIQINSKNALRFYSKVFITSVHDCKILKYVTKYKINKKPE